MADTKLANLTEDASPGTDSLVYTVDDPSGTPVDRKVTLSNLMGLAQTELSDGGGSAIADLETQTSEILKSETFTSGGTADRGVAVTDTLNDAGAAGGSDLYSAYYADITETDKTGWDNVYVANLNVGGSPVFQVDDSGNVTVGGTVDGRDLATDGTKLDGIEASADVTDQANVSTAATAGLSGEILKSETFTSGGTADRGVAVTDTLNDAGAAGGSDVYSAYYANITETDKTGWDNVYALNLNVGGSPVFQVDDAGNTTVGGTVDGRDLATDGTKLDGVEALADVTDATNVAAAGAIMDSDISESDGMLRKTGAGAYEAVKINTTATVAPGATDDTGSGYAVGSTWIDVTGDKAYICVDASASAAVWNEAGAGTALANVVEDTTPQLGGTLDMNSSAIQANNASGATIVDEAASSTNPTLIPLRTDTDSGLGSAGADAPCIVSGGYQAYTPTETGGNISHDFAAGDGATGNLGCLTQIASSSATLTAAAGTSITASGLFPAGSLGLGVTSRVTTTFGTANGLTSLDIGKAAGQIKWGDSVPYTAGSTTDMTDSSQNPEVYSAAQDVVVTANGGTGFEDGVGVIEVVAHYITLTAPTG